MCFIEIYFEDNSESARFYAEQKGFRVDTFAYYGNKYYKLNVYSIVRLTQEFYNDIKTYGCYHVDPNLILVEDVTNDEIIKTITELVEQGFFEELKPIEYPHDVNLQKVYPKQKVYNLGVAPPPKKE